MRGARAAARTGRSRARRAHPALLGVLAAHLVACTSTQGDLAATSSGEEDAATGRTPSFVAPDGEPPRRGLTVKLPPVVEIEWTDDGVGDGLVSLAGARVCADRWRRPGGTWDEWTLLPDDDRWCAVSEAYRETVLREVPEQSEVVVTARLDGYLPSAFPLLVGDQPVDFAALPGWVISVLELFREDGPFPFTGGRTPVDGELGALILNVVAPSTGRLSIGGNFELAALGAATFSLLGDAGEGPFYAPGGRYHPTLTETVGSANTDPDYTPGRVVGGHYEGLSAGVIPIARITTWTTFLGLPEGDHHAMVEHERATCDLNGWHILQPLWGFRERTNVIRVPVLPGHITPTASFWCTCDASDGFNVPEYADPLTCRLASGDADAGAD
jgi:hypothetical protein